MAASKVKAAKPRRRAPGPSLGDEIRALGEIVCQQAIATRQLLDKITGELVHLRFDTRILCKFADEAATARAAAARAVADAPAVLQVEGPWSAGLTTAGGAPPWYGMPGTATPAWVAEVNRHIGEILRQLEGCATTMYVTQSCTPLWEKVAKLQQGLESVTRGKP